MVNSHLKFFGSFPIKAEESPPTVLLTTRCLCPAVHVLLSTTRYPRITVLLRIYRGNGCIFTRSLSFKLSNIGRDLYLFLEHPQTSGPLPCTSFSHRPSILRSPTVRCDTSLVIFVFLGVKLDCLRAKLKQYSSSSSQLTSCSYQEQSLCESFVLLSRSVPSRAFPVGLI